MATLNEPLPQGTGSGSGPRCQVTILGVVEAQTREETTLFSTMLVIDQTGHSEGSAIPVRSEHTPLMAPSTESHPDTSAQSPITETHTSPPQITEPPTSSTLQETIRQEVEIPQSNFPTQTPVADEATFTGVDVVHGRVVTTVSSIDTGQGSSNITKSPTMPHDLPLPRGHTPGRDEGSMTLHNNGSNVTISHKTVKASQARRRTKIIASDDEEDLVAEDPSKHGRSIIEEIDLDAGISLVPLHVEVQGRYSAFERHLEEIHVTWAHLEKKRIRLWTYTNISQD
ncbi:hypothetical protein Tco_1385229 [Tanacetum coccineum]